LKILIKPKKSLGQNFLVDRRVTERIIAAVSPLRSDVVIEIGPGTGALTKSLVERSGTVVAVELDERLAKEIKQNVAAENLIIVRGDALAVNWNELVDEAVASLGSAGLDAHASRRVRVVANLPYYISTAIIERLIGLRRRLSDMTLMLQDEVVERIVSGPGRREYGYLSILVQFYCEARKLFEVAPSAFKPAPKVRSAVIRLTVRERAAVEVDDEERFFALVKAAFAQRRKTILNNLKAGAVALGLKRDLAEALERAGIDPRRRAETLSLQDFGLLYAALFSD
jgi:16S rRNA (adenine1518-N6/adenine1519-N6)-dimethyltransferase